MSKITPQIIHEHGEEKFTALAVDIRQDIGRALTGNGHVPAFLNRMSVAQMAPWAQFVESPAFQYFDRENILSGGRKLYAERREMACEAHLTQSRLEAQRWATVLDTDQDTLAIEPEGWMLMR